MGNTQSRPNQEIQQLGTFSTDIDNLLEGLVERFVSNALSNNTPAFSGNNPILNNISTISSIPATVMAGIETLETVEKSMKNIQEICTRLEEEVDELQDQQNVIGKSLALQGLCLQQLMLTDCIETYSSALGGAIKVGDSELHEEETQLRNVKEVEVTEAHVQKTKSKKKKGRNQATPNASSQTEEPKSNFKAAGNQASLGHLQPKSCAGRSLVRAAEAGNVSELQALLDVGADPNITGVGVTALQRAASRGHLLCVSLLLKRRARPDIPEVLGRTALHLASLHGHVDCMVELIKHKASVTHKDLNGQMPLHYAALGGFEEAVKEILKRGVDVDVTDEYGQTPLYLAVMFDKPGSVRPLLAAGAKRRDKEGDPMLNFARSDRVLDLIENWYDIY